MQNYSENTKEIQDIIIQLIGKEVDTYDAIEAYYEIMNDESPLP